MSTLLTLVFLLIIFFVYGWLMHFKSCYYFCFNILITTICLLLHLFPNLVFQFSFHSFFFYPYSLIHLVFDIIFISFIKEQLIFDFPLSNYFLKFVFLFFSINFPIIQSLSKYFSFYLPIFWAFHFHCLFFPLITIFHFQLDHLYFIILDRWLIIIVFVFPFIQFIVLTSIQPVFLNFYHNLNYHLLLFIVI